MRFARTAAIVVLVAISVGNATAAAPKPGAPKAAPVRLATTSGFERVKIGDTTKKVITFMGRNFSVCPHCAPVTWIYETEGYDPMAFVVRFEHGKVASAFPISEPPAE
jgi:hypothetical protein